LQNFSGYRGFVFTLDRRVRDLKDIETPIVVYQMPGSQRSGTESSQTLCWRKRDSNRRSLFSNDRDLARKQFLYSTVGLVDRCVRVGCGGGVGIGNRDRAEPSAPELMRRLPLRPVRIE
jgi:hypothetical protein